jgi:acetoacetyl-CoA synthetase
MNDIEWTPSHIEQTRMWQFMRFLEPIAHKTFQDYQALHAFSVANARIFWQALYDFFGITFDTPATEILHPAKEMMDARWFIGARFNFAEQLLKREDAHPAIVSIDEQGHRVTLSYNLLKENVIACASGMKILGVEPGDRVAAIMPNVHFTIIAMLATATLGAIWSSCSPDFGASSILDRLSQIEPKLLFLCDGHHYHGKIFDDHEKNQQLIDAMPTLTHAVLCPIIGDNTPDDTLAKTINWHDLLDTPPTVKFSPFPFDHPLYILFSSGTTGKPKCIVHGAGGTLLQHVKELGLHTDLQSIDNLFFYTTCGWMMWNWMVSSLALGVTITIYDGSPTFPDANCLLNILENEQITVFGTSAKFISTLEKKGLDPKASFSFTKLRTILSTGSPLLPKNYDYVYQHIKSTVQLSSISGGTDIVSCFALGNPLLPVRRGEIQCIGLGMDVAIYNEQGEALISTQGELVCRKPFPSMPVGFWQDKGHTRFRHTYFEQFPGIWAHGDFAEITSHGGLIIYGRSDAILNPQGVRIGTAEIYRQVEKIPQVLDSVVIGQAYLDDVRIVLFVKLQEGIQLNDVLLQTIRNTIRTNASPRHVPEKILVVKDIPYTLNGKVVELAIRDTVAGLPVKNIESIANPEALVYFKNRTELLS